MAENLGITDTENKAANNWFRNRGVPLVIFKKQRLLELIPRSIPATLWLILTSFSSTIIWLILSLLNEESTGNPVESLGISEDALFLSILTLSFIIPFIFLIIPWILRRLLKKISFKVQYLLGTFLLLMLFITLSTGISEAPGEYNFIYFKNPIEGIALTLLVCLMLFYELDTIIIWAAKRTLHELWTLTPMIAKVLPVLMLAVLFAFVNGDIWRVAEALTLRRTFEVVGVLLLLSLFVAITTSIERTKKLLGANDDDYLEEFTDQEYAAAVQDAGEPWKRLLQNVPARLLKNRSHHHLSWSEWGNLIALPVLSQMIQALLFAVIVFIFFTWFGNLAIPADTITSWLGHSASNLQIAGLTIPLSGVLIKVSMILAAFASLNFVASTAADERYATEFLAPMMKYLREIVMIRNIYLAAQGR